MSTLEESVGALLDEAFAPGPSIEALVDANEGRGVFSIVVRAMLAWPAAGGPADDGARPASVVVKIPAEGPNGRFAIEGGACSREAIAYRRILPRSPIDSPRAYLVHTDGAAASFVLEDLGDRRRVDQLDGLEPQDALAVADSLARFHDHWRDAPELGSLGVRRSAPAGFDPTALDRGLDMLRRRWSDATDADAIDAFAAIVTNRTALVDAFGALGPPTLCHGDPRADNLVFGPDGAPIVYDWQQLAVQFGAADLSWLAATSVTPAIRRTIDADLAAVDQGGQAGYRLGFLLPGLAVLLLCQREITDERSARFVATSIDRIGRALVDLDVPRCA